MSTPWKNTNDPWETFANWELWIVEQMPDAVNADELCEIDVILRANLYRLFCKIYSKIEQLEDGIEKLIESYQKAYEDSEYYDKWFYDTILKDLKALEGKNS